MTSVGKTEEEDFNRLVDENIIRLLGQGMRKYCDLLMKLPGVYPSVTLQSIGRLRIKNLISPTLADSIINQSKQKMKYSPDMYIYKTTLPLPHPLDFEWRFSDAASEYLLTKCESLSPINQIIMLGTPSLFRYSNERRQPNFKTCFMGDHTSVTAGIEKFCLADITRCNVFYDLSTSLVGSHVILDPPWYHEFIQAFMWTAKQLCTMGGYLLISLPAIGTRPGIKHEWKIIQNWADELGLVLVAKEDSILSYSTPFFELNALRAEGINNVPREWRKGNLVIFQNTCSRNIEKPAFSKGTIWSEAIVNNVRFKVRVDKDKECAEFSDPSLERILDGDVLPSVSSKDERRSKAVVWTSGNRIFQSKGPEILFSILQGLENGQPTDCLLAERIKRNLTEHEISLVQTVSRQIMQIVNIENKEYSECYEV